MSIAAWHQRFNHLHQEDLLQMNRVGAIDIAGPKTLPLCDYCFRSKMKRAGRQKPMPRMTAPFARLHVDIAGGGDTLGKPKERSYQYFIVIADDATRIRWVKFLISRAEASPTLISFIKWLKAIGYKGPAAVRFDNEFMTVEVKDYF